MTNTTSNLARLAELQTTAPERQARLDQLTLTPPARTAAHAYPENSQIALCGHTGPKHHSAPTTTRCPVCETETGRKDWTRR